VPSAPHHSGAHPAASWGSTQHLLPGAHPAPWGGGYHQLAGAPGAFLYGSQGPPTRPMPPLPAAAAADGQGRRIQSCVIVNPLARAWAPLDPADRTAVTGMEESRPCLADQQGCTTVDQREGTTVSCSPGGQEEAGQGQEEGAEPIYAEIRAPVQPATGGQQQEAAKERDGVVVKEKEEEEGQQQLKKNKLAVVEGGKKSVEYWQITTKEMTKFRPCTQVVIRR
jgi:hypothetical protein